MICLFKGNKSFSFMTVGICLVLFCFKWWILTTHCQLLSRKSRGSNPPGSNAPRVESAGSNPPGPKRRGRIVMEPPLGKSTTSSQAISPLLCNQSRGLESTSKIPFIGFLIPYALRVGMSTTRIRSWTWMSPTLTCTRFTMANVEWWRYTVNTRPRRILSSVLREIKVFLCSWWGKGRSPIRWALKVQISSNCHTRKFEINSSF